MAGKELALSVVARMVESCWQEFHHKGHEGSERAARNAQAYFLATASARIVPVLVWGSFLHAARTNSDTTMPAVPTASHDLMRGIFKRFLPCVILMAGKHRVK